MNFNTNGVRGRRLTRIFEEFIFYCDDANAAEISHGERKQSCPLRESRIVYDAKRNAFTIFLCALVSQCRNLNKDKIK